MTATEPVHFEASLIGGVRGLLYRSALPFEWGEIQGFPDSYKRGNREALLAATWSQDSTGITQLVSKRSLSGRGAWLRFLDPPKPTNRDNNMLIAMIIPKTMVIFSLVERWRLPFRLAISQFSPSTSAGTFFKRSNQTLLVPVERPISITQFANLLESKRSKLAGL